MNSFGPLISTDWLVDHLDALDVKIIDGSWRMPGQAPAIDDYNRRHIPGAVFFDIDAIADRSTSLPHMLPPPQIFEQAVGAMGVSENDCVVVYDDKGVFSAPRVWWTFRAMGHRNVAVLDGGLPKWLAEDRPVTPEAPVPAPASYCAAPKTEFCKSADDVRAALASESASVADARLAARFAGEAPEPRPGLRSGHMPGAFNTPFTLLLNDDGAICPAEKLKAAFSSAGIDLSRPIITSCGSGITAAILSLALEIIGHKDHSLYDGSWAEWGDVGNDDAKFPTASGK